MEGISESLGEERRASKITPLSEHEQMKETDAKNFLFLLNYLFKHHGGDPLFLHGFIKSFF